MRANLIAGEWIEGPATVADLNPSDLSDVVEEFAPPAGPGQDYTVDEALALAGDGLRGTDFADGRRLYHAAACYSCHPFAGSGGGVGPDLTGSASRYTLRDLLENIIEPSKVISDQYGSELVELPPSSSSLPSRVE